ADCHAFPPGPSSSDRTHCHAPAGGVSISTILSRPRIPRTTATSLARTSRTSARAAHTAVLALPSVAGARTATTSASPRGPCHRPCTRSRLLPGLTRTVIRSGSLTRCRIRGHRTPNLQRSPLSTAHDHPILYRDAIYPLITTLCIMRKLTQENVHT